MIVGMSMRILSVRYKVRGVILIGSLPSVTDLMGCCYSSLVCETAGLSLVLSLLSSH